MRSELTISQVEVDDVTIRVGRRGAGSPLLLLNGAGCTIERWGCFLDALGDRELIVFDPPGLGGSSRSSRPLTMPAVACRVWQMMDRLGYATVDVFGCSLGGALAQEVAHLRPEQVRRLVLAATSPGIGGYPFPPAILAALSNPLRFISREYLAAIAPCCYGGEIARNPALLRAYVDGVFACPRDPIGLADNLFALHGWTSLPWLHTLGVPALVLHGDDDRLIPYANAHLLHGCLPNSELQVVPKAGHLFLIDQTEDAAAPVRAFLDADGLAAGARLARAA